MVRSLRLNICRRVHSKFPRPSERRANFHCSIVFGNLYCKIFNVFPSINYGCAPPSAIRIDYGIVVRGIFTFEKRPRTYMFQNIGSPDQSGHPVHQAELLGLLDHSQKLLRLLRWHHSHYRSGQSRTRQTGDRGTSLDQTIVPVN